MQPVNTIDRDLYILWNYVLRRTHKPFMASFKLTYRCNLTCDQCPFHTMADSQVLSSRHSGCCGPEFDRVIEMMDQMHTRGDRLVVFEGGEPMLWRDGVHTIHDVVAEARKRFFSVGMTTNGTLPLDVATDVLWVSIDGLRETHNRLRGGPIFDKVIANIRQSKHPRLYAHITINNQNAAEVPELVRFLAGIVRGITVQFYYPYNHQMDLFLDFDRREKLLEELIRMKRSGFPVLNSVTAMRAMQRNRWRCVDYLMDCANPDGSITQGCYLKSREDIDCALCGFSPHTEISLAHQGNLDAILAGVNIFFRHA